MVALKQFNQIRKAVAEGKKVLVTFKVATRSGCRKATRVVQEVWPESLHSGRLEVRYNGWSNFVLKAHEISSFEIQEGS